MRGRVGTLQEQLFFDVADGRAAFKVAARSSAVLQWIAAQPSERAVASWVHAALAATPAGEVATMLDIGANAGYFGLMSIALGAQAVFFDPQPACWACIRSAIEVNGFGDRGWLVPRPLASSAQPRLLDVSGSWCSGQFPLVLGKVGANSPLGYGVPAKQAREGPRDRMYVETTTLEAAAGDLPVSIAAAVRAGPIQLVKVDVEGNEIGLIRHNLLPLFRARRVRHAIVEVTPTAWRFAANATLQGAMPARRPRGGVRAATTGPRVRFARRCAARWRARDHGARIVRLCRPLAPCAPSATRQRQEPRRGP